MSKRYEGEPKLNYKKIVAVLVGIVVLIMLVSSIIKIIKGEKEGNLSSGKSYFTMYANNKWGIIDNEGAVVMQPTYEEMIIIPNKEKPIFVRVYDINDETGTYKTKVVNEKNEEILKQDKYDKYEAIDNYDSKQNIWYEDNVLRVGKNGKYGLIDFTGKELLSCDYTEITALKGTTGNFLVRKESFCRTC